MNEIDSSYRELVEGKEDFQNILHILVEFDERTKAHLRYPDAATHYVRKSISLSQPQNIRILLKSLGNFIYSVVAQSQTEGGLAVSTYVHEDGIRKEREAQGGEHPVHKIVCLTDLYETSNPTIDYKGLCAFALELLNRRDNAQETSE